VVCLLISACCYTYTCIRRYCASPPVCACRSWRLVCWVTLCLS
jgi:hypothetical protein